VGARTAAKGEGEDKAKPSREGKIAKPIKRADGSRHAVKKSQSRTGKAHWYSSKELKIAVVCAILSALLAWPMQLWQIAKSSGEPSSHREVVIVLKSQRESTDLALAMTRAALAMTRAAGALMT
jgi:hypothetical protein